jgi:hypothetical protein
MRTPFDKTHCVLDARSAPRRGENRPNAIRINPTFNDKKSLKISPHHSSQPTRQCQADCPLRQNQSGPLWAVFCFGRGYGRSNPVRQYATVFWTREAGPHRTSSRSDDFEPTAASIKIEYGGFAAPPGAPENQDDIDQITMQDFRVATCLSNRRPLCHPSLPIGHFESARECRPMDHHRRRRCPPRSRSSDVPAYLPDLATERH